MVLGPDRFSLITAERTLDLLQNGQEAFRRDIRLKLYDPVQEPAIAGLGMILHGLGLVEQRHPETCECGSRLSNVTARSQKSTRSPTFEPNPMNTVSINHREG